MRRVSGGMKPISLAMLAALVCPSAVIAADYHVSINGDDNHPGSQAQPFRTISAAAAKAMPGDTVTVRAGVYRERVDPPRGGTSDETRITYQAAPGERVVITGSEPARQWQHVAGDTWKTVIPNRKFGAFNPYSDLIRGDWFSPNGRVHHTGCVYLNGEPLTEAAKLADVTDPAGKTPLWFATVDGDTGAYLLNVAWFKPSSGPRVPAGEPAFRYGGKPAPCGEGGTCSGFIRTGDWLRFDEVDFGAGSDRIEFRVAAAPDTGGIIEARIGSPSGKLLGTGAVGPTDGWQNWKSLTIPCGPITGRHTVALVFKHPATDGGNTTIHARFPGKDPNHESVEINFRQTVFYPSRNGINHLTVQGFVLENAAANWAPPSAEQPAIIGTNWSKGWIIESNTIRHSPCCGISLGKYGDGYDNTNDAGAADPYTACVRRALERGWNRDTVGSHTVRDNIISHCEQTGIVGSLGCAFSTITGNEIHDIHRRQLFGGAEQAGIKLHGAVDVLIDRNHIHRCNRGIWLDWMAQGARVSRNLLHDNGPSEDIFCEMQHGPLVLSNNILLSPARSLWINSKGLAIVHNLMLGPIACTPYDARKTPFHPPHSTAIAGLADAPGGDHRIYHNVFAGKASGTGFDNATLAVAASGNVYTHGTLPSRFDQMPTLRPGSHPGATIENTPDGWFLTITTDPAWRSTAARQTVTTELLGKATVPDLPYENPDGTPLRMDTDFFGNRRLPSSPFPGPFEQPYPTATRLKVWPPSR